MDRVAEERAREPKDETKQWELGKGVTKEGLGSLAVPLVPATPEVDGGGLVAERRCSVDAKVHVHSREYDDYTEQRECG